MDSLWVQAALIVGLVVVAGLTARLFYARNRGKREQRARLRFLQQREHLEAQFFTAASRSGKPRGLRWKECDWESNVEFARERATGKLSALVSVTISFEAIEGGDMEGVAAVGNLRNASAVFHYNRGRWETAGKAIFNLNPDEAIQHFGTQYERIEAR